MFKGIKKIRKTTEQYKSELIEINNKNNTNIRLKDGVEYINTNTKIIHICTCGKEWNTYPHTILSSQSKRCGKCYDFEKWCIDNNRQDVLDRWDYELNNCKPSEIAFSVHKKYYFKCPKGIHKSELKIVRAFTNGQEGSMFCAACNSFAQWGIDNLGEDFLEKYWDYEKNTVDPWEVSYSTDNKVYLYCQEKDYHESYDIACSSFITGSRCSYCANHKVHPLDSLGKLLEDKGLLHLWSDKNKKSPWRYKPNSGKEKVWWKCPDKKHEDYLRHIGSSNTCNFRCPECSNEQKESIMATTLKQVLKYEYPNTEWEYNAGFIAKKRISKYDIFVPELNNLLIECQSEYHDGEKQQKTDKLKKQYALNNGYNYLDIDKRNYSPLEAIQLFFPSIKEIPEYVDISKETIRTWDIKEAQNLLDNGYTYPEVANILNITSEIVRSAISQKVLTRPSNYKRKSLSKRVKVVCLNMNNELIKIYNSITEAKMELNINNIEIACKNNNRSAGGFKWMYYDEYINKGELNIS